MKNKVLFLAIAVLGASSLKAQLNVGSTSAADPSAILQATSTTKGFLPPVMTTTQINAIVSPAKGLAVYNSTLSQLQINVGTAAVPSWSVAAGGANVYWSQLGNTGSVPGTNYIGTTDNSSLGFRTNGVERVRIDSSTGYVGIGTTTPHAALQFANIQRNKTLVLWDDGNTAANDSAFYGFGINSSTLRYQVPNGGNHSFYNNKTLVANINSAGSLYLTGNQPVVYFQDQSRTNRNGAIYSLDGKIRLWNSISGDGFSVDTVGNTIVGGKLLINNLPASTSTQVLTTDGSGNIGQTTLQPTVFGVGNQNGVTGVAFAPSANPFQYIGWTITIPAFSKYKVNIQMLMGKNNSYTTNSAIYLTGQFSSTQASFTSINGTSYAIPNAPYLFIAGLGNVSNEYQLMTGNMYLQNPSATPVVLYYFMNSNEFAGGYTGSVFVGGNNAENYIVGTPFY